MRYFEQPKKRKKKIKQIVVHCSASDFGDKDKIDEWHKNRGFKSCGYHFVILNGNVSSNSYDKAKDGVVEYGRNWWENGAHVRGHNKNTIGICLIGLPKKIHSLPFGVFTIKQLRSLFCLLYEAIRFFELSPNDIVGHNEIVNYDNDPYNDKLCPGFNVEFIRKVFKYMPGIYFRRHCG